MSVNFPRRVAFAIALTLTCVALAGRSFAQHYTRTDLTANMAGIAPNTDPNLVNAWGMARATGSPWWISDNSTGLTTLYDANGVPQSLVVTIPNPNGGASAPTGTVFNAFSAAFELAPTFRSIFLFATEDGTISGWNPNVNLNSTIIKIDHSKQGAVYKGLAIGMTAGGPRIYTTNFAAGVVEVYDSKFRRLNKNTGFMDEKLPANYAPFGIQNVGGNIVVTFAHRKPGSLDEDHGPGLGYVDVFDLAGHLLLRLQHTTAMNAPWGIALAPASFGEHADQLLVGNFGSGTIMAFDADGKFRGLLEDKRENPIVIEGLWGLTFGNGGRGGEPDTLYFSAGPAGEEHGLFGSLAPVKEHRRHDSQVIRRRYRRIHHQNDRKPRQPRRQRRPNQQEFPQKTHRQRNPNQTETARRHRQFRARESRPPGAVVSAQLTVRLSCGAPVMK